jgi:hypothetical protein
MEETLLEWIGEVQVGNYEREPRIEQNLETQVERRREHMMIVAQERKTLKKYHQW